VSIHKPKQNNRRPKNGVSKLKITPGSLTASGK